MVFNAVDDAPRLETIRRIEGARQRLDIHERVAPAACLRDSAAYSVAQSIAPRSIETKTLGRRPHRGCAIGRPVLGDLDRLRLDRARGAGQVLAKPAAAMRIDDR